MFEDVKLRHRNSHNRFDAYLIYLVLEGATALILQLVQTIYIVFYTVSGGLDPFQVVLMGTLFETTIFLFEIPTGIVADVYSRRLSIIIGHTMLGAGFLLEGLFPGFGTILASEIVTGIGGTFTSGATEAWITDEIGVERAAKAFLRAAQVRTASSMIGIGASVALASIQLNLPFIVAGILLIGLALFLIAFMPESGFQARPKSERASWHALLATFRNGLSLVRRSRILIAILAIGFIFAAHGEGFDHLWQIHLLNDYQVPGLGMLKPIVWFGIIGATASLLSIGLNELARRRINLVEHSATGRALMLIYSLSWAGILVFALSGSFGLAAIAYCMVAALRNSAKPISDAWLNQSLEPSIRATMFSMNSQVMAIGEIAGGPPVGFIGTVYSVRAALVASAVLLSMTVPVFFYVLGRFGTFFQPISVADLSASEPN